MPLDPEDVYIPESTDETRDGAKIGDLHNGGIYVGKSATTGYDLHAALTDEPEYLDLDGAFEAVARMRKIPGRENAHVPTRDELDVNLFRNRFRGHLKGTFNTTADDIPGSLYRSSLMHVDDRPIFKNGMCWTQWFDSGFQDLANGEKENKLSVRLVW